MLQTFALAFVILLLVVAGMALGVIFKNRPLAGSCGGLAADGRCTACGREAVEREGCNRSAG